LTTVEVQIDNVVLAQRQEALVGRGPRRVMDQPLRGDRVNSHECDGELGSDRLDLIVGGIQKGKVVLGGAPPVEVAVPDLVLDLEVGDLPTVVSGEVRDKGSVCV